MEDKVLKKPKCKLIGIDSNVFVLGGMVKQALEKANQPDRAKEFSERLFKCGSYGEALSLMQEYVDVY